ncbi:hypothetical protein [Brevibacterium litoralis]|uniref:hypothetical protein n=1 Tax=Brevibacterium litoralis TaxID=3138935 RepID=UPI0032EBFFF0
MMDRPRGKDSFSIPYRIAHGIKYALLTVTGPSNYPAAVDPRKQSKREYERRKSLYERWHAQRSPA